MKAVYPGRKSAAGRFGGYGLAAAAFLSFFIFGFSDVLKGTAIPEIISETAVEYNTGGALIGFTYLGFFFGTLGSVFLLGRRQPPRLLAAAVITVCAGLFCFSIAPGVAMMFAAAFLIGAGGGLIDVTANLTIRMTADESVIGRRLNQLAFFHGSGAIVSPLFAGLVLALTAKWRSIYLFAAVFTAAAVAAVTLLTGLSRNRNSVRTEKHSRLRIRPSIALPGGILFFYMTLEAGISGWMVEYGRAVSGLSQSTSLLYLSMFFILLTAGRFLSSFYVDRLGLYRTVLFNFLAIFILASCGVIIEGMFFLIPVCGLFMAPIFPTTVALISNELGSTNIRIMGVFFSVAGLGGIFGPWMIGLLAEGFSLQSGLTLLIVFSICAITVCTLYKFVSGNSIR